ncbi:MAG: hypothetical protein M3303_06865, partial [Gemmatimonadota bacterium]|nr:hypothetical protein [Gemmatimonadota bacterium]
MLAAALCAIGVTTPEPVAAQQQAAPAVSQQGHAISGDTARAAPGPTLRRRPTFSTRDFVLG